MTNADILGLVLQGRITKDQLEKILLLKVLLVKADSGQTINSAALDTIFPALTTSPAATAQTEAE